MRMRISRLFDEKLFLRIIFYKLHILCNAIIFLIQNINYFSLDFFMF